MSRFYCLEWKETLPEEVASLEAAATYLLSEEGDSEGTYHLVNLRDYPRLTNVNRDDPRVSVVSVVMVPHVAVLRAAVKPQGGSNG